MSEVRMIFSFLLAFALVGCSFLSRPENQPIAKMAVQYGTIRFIEAAADDRQLERAERVKAIALDIKETAAGDESTTIPALDTLIHAKVPWERLSASDIILAESLITIIEQELQVRLGQGTLTAEQQLVISDVAQWVIDAAKLGGAQ